ncbi:hypothetical protein XA68_17885 [Ophiocordyceps unilateralis]|uniref:SMP-30/Gluconolactonase/LRE-like region domain-containing protein n=1 Tax=Ophiocordyceps unilateralis TaxID=268505 RepID=A0A2A9PJN5_OPHUN|nr:hypothetical protein XA68_17885 [Ophiocordyceps unilateralis]
MVLLLPLILLSSSALASVGRYKPAKAAFCNVPPGNKLIDSFQLYPENASFDPKRCLVYFSVLWNNSVAIWDPVHNQIVGSLDDPKYTGRTDLHANAVSVDECRDELTTGFTAATAWDTNGRVITGQNNIARYSLSTFQRIWDVDLSNVTHNKYGGYQDVAQDVQGNIFVAGTYPPSLLRVVPSTRMVDIWYLGPPDSNIAGLQGLVNYQDKKILATYQTQSIEGSQLVSFNINHPGRPKPIPVKQGNRVTNRVGTILDAAVLPPLYGQKVLLAPDAHAGTVVLYSDDDWNTAHRLGVVPTLFPGEPNGPSVVSSVQAGQRVFSIYEFFEDGVVKAPGLPKGPGNRNFFPLQDVTDGINRLLLEFLSHGASTESNEYEGEELEPEEDLDPEEMERY